MKGYTGFRSSGVDPNPFASGGSTFTGAKVPSYLSSLSDLATPEEWRTQGSAFIRNPQMLENRARLEQFGRERKLGEAQSSIEMAKIGDVRQAGQRAYTFGRETEELERLRMANEGRRLQSQMSFLPQMEALRGGIASRMASSLGVSLPSGDNRPYSSGTGYRPSWMQSYQTPQFPRY